MQIGEKFLLHCERCATSKQHIVLYIDQRDDSRYDETGPWALEHTLTRGFLECVDCAWPKLRIHVFTLPIEQETEFSIPPEPARHFPHWISELPSDVQRLLIEVYAAFAEKRYWLVAMGCRSLIDMFALERVGDLGGFALKLRKLEEEGHLASRDALLVTQALEVGHGATHRRDAPTLAQCSAVLDIVEHLIQKLALTGRAELLNIAAAKKIKAKKS